MLDARTTVAVLKAAAEPTRLRILLLLAGGDLNVKDLTRILGQSQPRISRHLKLLTDAGVIERAREGSWVYFQLSSDPILEPLVRGLVTRVDSEDPVIARDRARADQLKAERERAAQTYFRSHAAEWDRIRALHVGEQEVEAAMTAMLAERPPADLLVDLGTGTGRMLQLFAGRFRRAIGYDANTEMLAYARSKLGAAGLTEAQVRHGDIYDVQLADGSADVVVMHQVLHFLTDPGAAVREAARLLAPAGRLLIVDFAPHDLDYLRDQFAHERLGFSRAAIDQLMTEAGLAPAGYRELAPKSHKSDGDDRLTVSVWIGTKKTARAVAAKRHKSTQGEKAV
jgi:ArsR family transcriptional regulator